MGDHVSNQLEFILHQNGSECHVGWEDDSTSDSYHGRVASHIAHLKVGALRARLCRISVLHCAA